MEEFVQPDPKFMYMASLEFIINGRSGDHYEYGTSRVPARAGYF